MAARKTYLYEVVITKSNDQDFKFVTYFYGRNAASVTKYCEEHYRPEFKYDGFQCVKVGESKLVKKDPVIEFTKHEKEWIVKQLYPEEMGEM